MFPSKSNTSTPPTSTSVSITPLLIFPSALPLTQTTMSYASLESADPSTTHFSSPTASVSHESSTSTPNVEASSSSTNISPTLPDIPPKVVPITHVPTNLHPV